MNTVILKNKKSVLLNKTKTSSFLLKIDSALKTLKSDNIISVINHFELENYSEISEFINQTVGFFGFWDDESYKIKEINRFESKCIACSFGKKVMAYEVQSYTTHKNGSIMFLYTREFAINFEIEDEELIGFSWCNNFLNQDEIKKL